MADTSIPAIVGSVVGGWLSAFNTTIGLINSRFASRPYVWANNSARTTFLATAVMTVGEYGYQTDTQTTYRATSSTTAVAWSSPWITYTATLTNITLGTAGTSVFQYRYENGSVRVRGRIKLGSAGIAVGTDPTFTLPISSRALVHTYEGFFGRSYGYDISGINNFTLNVAANNTSTTVAIIQALGASGAVASVTATVPFTWAINDSIDIDCLYEIV